MSDPNNGKTTHVDSRSIRRIITSIQGNHFRTNSYVSPRTFFLAKIEEMFEAQEMSVEEPMSRNFQAATKSHICSIENVAKF
jgi:hypothetical protein